MWSNLTWFHTTSFKVFAHQYILTMESKFLTGFLIFSNIVFPFDVVTIVFSLIRVNRLVHYEEFSWFGGGNVLNKWVISCPYHSSWEVLLVIMDVVFDICKVCKVYFVCLETITKLLFHLRINWRVLWFDQILILTNCREYFI